LVTESSSLKVPRTLPRIAIRNARDWLPVMARVHHRTSGAGYRQQQVAAEAMQSVSQPIMR
jgi:hypothetical protein